MTTDYFLGVDGGGTKTVFTVIDRAGSVIATHQDGTSYYLQIGFEALEHLCIDGVSAVLTKAKLSAEHITHAFFGLPAYGEDSRITARLDALPHKALGHRRYTCGNDMVCGWAGSLACADGINIVAGTGSIGYGERQSRSARGGGWGELFSDEGSAYWIAVQGLNIFSRMSDGRLPKGPLYTIFMEDFHLAHDLDLSGILMADHASDRDRIADISKLVAKAATMGDETAQHIFDSAAVELVGIVSAICRTLGFSPSEPVPVSYSGGVFKAGELILTPFKRALAAAPHLYDLIQPKHEPWVGAALYAMKCAQ